MFLHINWCLFLSLLSPCSDINIIVIIMEDKPQPLSLPSPPLVYNNYNFQLRNNNNNNAYSHMYNARVQAVQSLQEEVEMLRKDINLLKQMVADREFDMLVWS